MSLLIIGIATVILLPLSVYLFSKVDQDRGHSTISLDDLNGLSLDTPPVIVSQMKDGKVQKTFCYFSPYDYEVVPEAAVVEVDARDRFLTKLRPDNTITIPA